MPDSTFTQAFLETAALHAAMIAVESPHRKLSYAELETAARQCAGGLLRDGLPPGGVVAVDLPKGPELIIAMLGIWMAGGVYLPMDGAWPANRKSEATCRANAALTLHELPGHESEGLRPAAPEDPAYIIFTSGSTGRPKAVQVKHQSLFRVLKAQIQAFGLGPGTRSLFVLNPAFDASLSDIGTALLSGGTLVIPVPGSIQDLGLLASELRGRRITYCDLPPSLLAKLDPASFPELDTVVVGGEVCAAGPLRDWALLKRVFNVYGPTEATICTSLGQVDGSTWEKPLLGQPLAGVGYHICDSELKLLAQGGMGELVITGETLAMGYLGDPELQASRFITLDGVPAYRTGDRVTWREDGEFEFHGRMDRQLKVRGMLVEPAEIERHMLSMAGVTRAVVLQSVGRRRLEAFYEGTAKVGDLRDHLVRQLPPGLLPSRLERREALPETTSGKVDSLALLSGAITELGGPIVYATSAEADLARMFADVLGMESIPRNGDFFELGGDSFGVLELLAISESKGWHLTAGEIYRHRTVAGLASLDRIERVSPFTTSSLKEAAASIHLPPLPAASSEGNGAGTVLVTGAAGHLGSRVIPELLARDDRSVICVVHRPSPELEVLAKAQGGRLKVLIGEITQPQLG